MKEALHLNRLRTQQAAQLCSHFKLGAAAGNLLESCPDVSSLLCALMAQKFWSDAVLLLSHGLQKRTAVWWSCQVCRDWLPQSPTSTAERQSPELLAIEQAEQWVRDPQEKHRLAARVAGIAAGNRSPAHWAAMAAFWSAGSMTPDTGIQTPAPPFLYARAVAAAVDFAAARSVTQRDAVYRSALQRGIDLATGGD